MYQEAPDQPVNNKNNDFMRGLECHNLTDIDKIRENIDSPWYSKSIDPAYMFYRCEFTQYYWTLKNNIYENCNQADKGAILTLENGAMVNITGPESVARNNSAIEGGFAYIKGEGTQINLN